MRLKPTFRSFTGRGLHVRRRRRIVFRYAVLVVDPGRADRLALQVRRLADLRLRQRDDRGERLLHERADAHHVQPLVARPQHLGLVRDRQVHAPGRHLLDRRRRVGRLADLHVEARPARSRRPPGRRRCRRGRRSGSSRASARRASSPDGSSTSCFSPQPAASSAAAAGEQRRAAASCGLFLSVPRTWQVAPPARRGQTAPTAMRVRRTIPAYTRGVWS